jgi:hypothetical protein
LVRIVILLLLITGCSEPDKPRPKTIRKVRVSNQHVELFYHLCWRKSDIIKAGTRIEDYNLTDLIVAAKKIPAIAQKDVTKARLIIAIPSHQRWAILESKDDMVWDEKMKGWHINKDQWLPVNTPYTITEEEVIYVRKNSIP